MSKRSTVTLPKHLLDRISGDGFDDSQWRQNHNVGGKRKSRKESRKELRQAKKQKRSPHQANKDNDSTAKRAKLIKTNKENGTPSPKPSKPAKEAKKKSLKSDRVLRPFPSAHDEELRRKDEEDAKYYAKKLGLKSLALNNEDDGLNDILGDLDFDHFSEADEKDNDENDEDEEDEGFSSGSNEDEAEHGIAGNEQSSSEERGSEGSDDDGSDDDEEMTAEETMAKLKALKSLKHKSNGNTKPSENSDLRIVKESDLSDLGDSVSGSDDADDSNDDESNEEDLNEDITKEDDSLSESDLQDSWDSEDDGEGDEEGEEPMTAEETMAKLAAIKQKKILSKPQNNTNKSANDSDDQFFSFESGSDTDAEDDDEEDDSDDEEDDDNPYVPPTRRGKPENNKDNAENSKPARDSEAVQSMRRAFKGALNRLTESTLPHVINEMQLTFMKNSHAEASEVLTNQLLELIGDPQPLQHTLFTVYSGLVAALYSSVGIGFAAHFVQELVEHLVQYPDNSANLLSLLVECYSLRVVSSKLLYDLMKKFLDDIKSPETLPPVELLLGIIRNGGSLLRSDDPAELKEVIVMLQQRMHQLGGIAALPTRMRFLVDAILALKNNRQKPLSDTVIASRHRIRKFLQNNNGPKGSGLKEALQVSLSDILDSKSRGKWWLVGASWKGNDNKGNSSVQEEEDKLSIDIDDEFGASTPDWLELAKKQRLNTDVRRAVFVALMGAEDYLDACLRIDKLGLKNKQERDVPHVILHCLNQESYYNPYYALVAGKQCSRHSTMKTFQFRLWDWLNSEPRGNPQTAMHYGRFYASLVGQRVMPLDVLKAADFLGGSSDVQIFLEVFCVTLYKELAKQAERLAKLSTRTGLVRIPGRDDVDRDGKEVVIMLTKVREPTVLRGLQIINKNILNSEAIQSAKDRSRIAWVAELTTDIIDELVHKL